MLALIADDDPTSRLVLNALVSRRGHQTLVAADGSSAWKLLEDHEVDVLLTDWMMPGLDGAELCRRARERSGPYVYVVLATALDCPEQVIEGMRAGADDYLVKPVDPLVLETRLIAAERVTALHRRVAHFQAEMERANRELLGQSLTDALTGLPNRRRMEQDLARVHERAIRSGRPYGLAMLDVDHFKLYNDHRGHPAGDRVLRTVAEVLIAVVRSGESVYRYGGEEFLLLVEEGGVEAVTAAAERVRSRIADLAIPHPARPSPPPVVTVSAGVAGWEEGRTSGCAEVLARADHALYEAKAAGRNRVASAAQTALSVGVCEGV
jgi:two-component system cell cycle response regulator